MALVFRGKKLSAPFVKKIKEYIQKTEKLSHRDQVLEYDKILSLCLKELGYKGTLAEKMKAYGKDFKNENAIWNAHKLRNKIAHEIDFQPSKKEYEVSLKAFKKEIRALTST
ncbi:hypothetical protein HON22_00960 [Candidatus Peregrinibacteria bacterium]|nr:hypothetical protein [Candidatus Peregrinibacteria bacterium]